MTPAFYSIGWQGLVKQSAISSVCSSISFFSVLSHLVSHQHPMSATLASLSPHWPPEHFIESSWLTIITYPDGSISTHTWPNLLLVPSRVLLYPVPTYMDMDCLTSMRFVGELPNAGTQSSFVNHVHNSDLQGVLPHSIDYGPTYMDMDMPYSMVQSCTMHPGA